MSEQVEKKQINVEVAKSQKERWQEYVDEDPDAASLAHLIRLSVESHINENDQDSNETLRQIDTKIDQQTHTLQNDIADIDDRIDALLAEVREAKSPHLKRAVYAILPILNDKSEEGKLQDYESLPLHERVRWSGKLADLAAWFQTDQGTMLDILQELEEDYNEVYMAKSTPDVVHFYRIEEGVNE